jgi:hypothetical protein
MRQRRFHPARCGAHETVNGPIGTEIYCDGSCLNEPCDECMADRGRSCAADCPELATYSGGGAM